MPSLLASDLGSKNASKSPIIKSLTAPINLTVLSRQILVDTVADVLDSMIKVANKDFVKPEEIPEQTIYHAKKLPAISVKEYLNRFAKFSMCHEDAFVYALVYLDRMGELVENFSLDSFNVMR